MVVNTKDPEAQVRSRLTSIHQLSQKFPQTTSEKDIIIPILSGTIMKTGALGATFMPYDDLYTPFAVIREGQILDTVDLNTWVEYFSASSIQSQCKICRKGRPATEICPLLKDHN